MLKFMEISLLKGIVVRQVRKMVGKDSNSQRLGVKVYGNQH